MMVARALSFRFLAVIPLTYKFSSVFFGRLISSLMVQSQRLLGHDVRWSLLRVEPSAIELAQ
jgi:hypothetical protein